MFGLRAPRHVRRRLAIPAAAIALVALAVVPAATLAAPGDVEITIASDVTWTVEDADAGIGPLLTLPDAAQFVCLNDSYPVGCPGGATEYGWPGAGWGADLSSIPGAGWIWAPGITGATDLADQDAYLFSKTINLPGVPVSGSLSVAADDGAELFVNGTSAGTAAGPGGLSTFDITSLLQEGSNTIVVRGANGLICNQACTYSSNPAGVVFGGTVAYAPSDEDPDPPARPTLPPTSTISSTTEGTPAGTPWWLLPLGAAALLTVVLAADRRWRRVR